MGDPQIYIRGFKRSTKQEDLRNTFGEYGNIKQIRIIRDYAFIVYESQEQAQRAVDEMNGKDFKDNKMKVEIAGQPRRPKGPQPDDECRYCRKLGHWKNDCPEFRHDKKKKRKRRQRSSSSSSRSSSSESERRYKKKKKYRKISKKHRRKSPSSDSSSGSSSSRSRSSSSNSIREEKKKKNSNS